MSTATRRHMSERPGGGVMTHDALTPFATPLRDRHNNTVQSVFASIRRSGASYRPHWCQYTLMAWVEMGPVPALQTHGPRPLPFVDRLPEKQYLNRVGLLAVGYTGLIDPRFNCPQLQAMFAPVELTESGFEACRPVARSLTAPFPDAGKHNTDLVQPTPAFRLRDEADAAMTAAVYARQLIYMFDSQKNWDAGVKAGCYGTDSFPCPEPSIILRGEPTSDGAQSTPQVVPLAEAPESALTDLTDSLVWDVSRVRPGYDVAGHTELEIPAGGLAWTVVPTHIRAAYALLGQVNAHWTW